MAELTMPPVEELERQAREIVADYYRSCGSDDMAADVLGENWTHRSSAGEGKLIQAIGRGLAAARAGLAGVENMRERGSDLSALRKANIDRQAIWCPDELPDLSFRGNELSGETGEACNVIKKLERERHGWRGSRDTKEHLAEELADVVICADLCALTAGIDLATAVVAKFNATSDKVGIPVKLRSIPTEGGDHD